MGLDWDTLCYYFINEMRFKNNSAPVYISNWVFMWKNLLFYSKYGLSLSIFIWYEVLLRKGDVMGSWEGWLQRIVPEVVAGAFYLEWLAQAHQLFPIKRLSNGFLRFEHFIIHDTMMISPNTQHTFLSMNIRFGFWCRTMTTWFPWFS